MNPQMPAPLPPPDNGTRWSRVEEARAYIARVKDPVVRVALEAALGNAAALAVASERDTPAERLERAASAPFDLLFYVRAVELLIRNRSGLVRLLSGDLKALDYDD